MPVLRNLFHAGRRLYRNVFEKQERADVSAVAEALYHTHLFQNLRRRSRSRLSNAVHRRRYERDEFIYYERDPGLGLYVVQRGRVRLLTEDETGTAHELRTVNEHEVFGVISLFGDYRRMETAQAVTETRLLGFFRPDLRTMIKRTPRTGAEVLMALARHVSTRQAKLLEVLVEEEDKVAAMRALDEAIDRMYE